MSLKSDAQRYFQSSNPFAEYIFPDHLNHFEFHCQRNTVWMTCFSFSSPNIPLSVQYMEAEFRFVRNNYYVLLNPCRCNMFWHPRNSLLLIIFANKCLFWCAITMQTTLLKQFFYSSCTFNITTNLLKFNLHGGYGDTSASDIAFQTLLVFSFCLISYYLDTTS